MSGFASILGRADLAASLLFGGSGAVVLGDVEFNGFEVPESITFGGKQQLAVHKFPGGARVIDAMGRDDKSLDWSGVFLSADAASRAVSVDEMRVAGEVVSLTWGSFSYQVVIESFDAEYRRSSHIPYRISCTVLTDDTAAPEPSLISAAVQVYADVNRAVGFVSALRNPPSAGFPPIDLSAAQSAVGTASASGFLLGSADHVNAVAALQAAHDGVSGSSGAVAANMATIASNAPPGSLVAGPTDLTNAATNAGNLAQMSSIGGYLGRALVNAKVGAT